MTTEILGNYLNINCIHDLTNLTEAARDAKRDISPEDPRFVQLLEEVLNDPITLDQVQAYLTTHNIDPIDQPYELMLGFAYTLAYIFDIHFHQENIPPQNIMSVYVDIRNAVPVLCMTTGTEVLFFEINPNYPEAQNTAPQERTATTHQFTQAPAALQTANV